MDIIKYNICPLETKLNFKIHLEILKKLCYINCTRKACKEKPTYFNDWEFNSYVVLNAQN